MRTFFTKSIIGLWVFSISSTFLLMLYFYSVSINLFNLFGDLPSLTRLENPKSELASELYSADGILLGKYFRENRSAVEYYELGKPLIQALTATEDIRFESHSGIDLRALLRVITSVFTGADKGGGSTLTQQLAKNLFDTRGDLNTGHLSKVPGLRTLIVKSKEWLLSIKLERSYTKKEILSMYLNTVSFGSNALGIKVASKTFFNKSPNELTIEEAAVLVGLLKAPTQFSPVLNPERALGRRNTVLNQMYRYQFISKPIYDSLKSSPIVLQYQVENHNQGMATYFRSVIREYLIKWSKERQLDLFSDGLKIYTTIDSRLQRYAEEAVLEHMKDQQAKFFEHWAGKNPWVDEEFKEIPFFIERTIKRSERYLELQQIYGNDTVAIYKELKRPIRTTLFTWNGEKDTTLSAWDEFKYYKNFLRAGFMAMDPTSGHIKAWVGGVNHKYFKFDHVMQSKRQPGSTFKPFVYTAFIDNGYHPCFEVIDAPVSFEVRYNKETSIWIPQNSDGVFSGEKLTIRQALGRSINSVTAAIMKKLGPETIVDYAKRLGITSPLEPVPALCLGSSDVSLYELVGAYSTFVNEGVWTKPFFITRIEDKNGTILQEFVPNKVEALNEETAYLMIHMLRGATQERNGTALGLYRWGVLNSNEIAAKTGTTSNYSDGWFIGLTKDIAAGAWVGGDDRAIHFRGMSLGQGARTAMPIWGIFMKKVYDDPSLGITKGTFKRPHRPLSVELNCERYKNTNQADSLSLQDTYFMPTDTEFKPDGEL